MMVSTRGIKLKFFEGERVLCYEPDPSKARVLYDSKVLDVRVNKDHKGRKVVEYFIHFQGWNSSWDRCVGEEYVLKDTAENRQLQKDLADKSQLQIGAYLYRRERKKHRRKTNDRVNASSEDGSCGSPVTMDDEEGGRHSSSSEVDSSADEDIVPVELTSEIKEFLEQDYFILHSNRKVHKLPAEPNVVKILETYWKYYVQNQLCCLNEKPIKYRLYNNFPKMRQENIQRNINICREVLDGLRIYFDFTLEDLLLYKFERGQVITKQAKCASIKNLNKEDNMNTKVENNGRYSRLMMITEEIFNRQGGHESLRSKSKRVLRSNRVVDTNSNGADFDASNNIKSEQGNNNIEANSSSNKFPVWKALPDYVYLQNPPPPSLVYGATHLARLFVKLPELLINSNMPSDKLNVSVRHLDAFIDYLSEHKEWFGEKFYIDGKIGDAK